MGVFVNGVGDEIKRTLLTTTGDIIAASAANTPARVAAAASGQVLTAQGAGVLPAWAAAATGAVTRAGGNTVEATTTSTTEVALISLTATAGAASPVRITASVRKSGGAAATATVFPLANGGYLTNPTSIVWSSATNQAEAGAYVIDMGTGVAGYVKRGGVGTIGRGNDTVLNQFFINNGGDLSNLTSVGMQGLVGDAAITLGADELTMYTWSSS